MYSHETFPCLSWKLNPPGITQLSFAHTQIFKVLTFQMFQISPFAFSCVAYFCPSKRFINISPLRVSNTVPSEHNSGSCIWFSDHNTVGYTIHIRPLPSIHGPICPEYKSNAQQQNQDEHPSLSQACPVPARQHRECGKLDVSATPSSNGL